eukprot:Rhum_TRINITY_DN10236_c0_g1::Rhum_TRINITY_DN10236_c0_g1_i1::g.37517::m.37517
MEEFKDVMLSEPPVRGFVSSEATGGGGGARSFENYKGILLCDRPTDNKMAVGVTEQPFLPPGRPERDLFGMSGRGQEGCLGLQPSQERLNRNTVARQARLQSGKGTAPTALSKHRKWLKDLSTVTKHLKLNQIEDEVGRDAQKKRFQDKEREKRIKIKESIRENGRTADSVVGALGQSKADSCISDSPPLHPAPPPAGAAARGGAAEVSGDGLPALSPEAQPAAAAQAPTPSRTKTAAGAESNKPKWAMTEDEAFEAEMREAQKLMDFAANVDYVKFIDDYEVREALAIMRERVENLAEEKHVEALKHPADMESTASTVGEDDATGEKKKKKKARVAAEAGGSRADWDSSATVGVAASKLINDDALRLAEYILNKSDNLRQVHSKLSLAKVLQNIALNKDISLSHMGAAGIPAAAANEVQQPRISDHTSGRGQTTQKARILTDLKQSKEYVQNLPYLYRCPSI